MMNLQTIKTALSLSCALAIIGCTNNASIEMNKTIFEDQDYHKAHAEASRSAEIYRDFESRYRVSATYLSPRFRAAFATRLKDLFTQEFASFDEASKNAGFFVSIESPDENEIDLNDSHLWTILMEIGGSKQKPVLIKRVTQKERWSPFFSAINKWSREYIIVFDSTPVSPNDPDMVDKKSVQLTLANSDAKVSMEW
jgi:hypothetical protein